MNAPYAYATGDAVPALRRVWFYCVVGLAAALIAYGAADSIFWAGRVGGFGLSGLLCSLGALFGVSFWLERQSDRYAAAARKDPVESALLETIPELSVPEAPVRKLMGGDLSVSSAKRGHASGDFFECIPWSDHVYDVAVGNVKGQGLAAALIVLETKSGLLQSVTRLMLRGESGVLPEVGRVVAETKNGLGNKLAAFESLATLCYARFDFDGGRLDWVDCGHAPIIHWQAVSRRAVALKGSNASVGITAGRAGFAPGDLLVLCSDGIVDVRNPAGERFGEERLVSAVEEASGLEIRESGLAIRSCVADFARLEKSAADGHTVVCVRVNGPVSTRCRRTWRIECPVGVSGLKLFRQQVQDVYAGLEMSRSVVQEEASKMLLALHEVLVNIIDHSVQEQGKKESSVLLEACLYDDRVEWTFSHGRSFFSPTCIPEPNEDGSQNHGYGLYIIEQTADSVRYYRNERGDSCVKLIKRFCREQAFRSTCEVSQ